ncbi:MAG TPA: hypothetical protein VFE50_24235 [Cyclobacteriaceae bacterium]|nr:hypothetical protein [Cyclobacteriaceae bacterium]
MGGRNNYNVLIILLLFSACGSDAFGQDKRASREPTGTYRVKPYETIFNTIWKDSLYRFDNFTDGRVRFINGVSRTYKLNYSLITGEMEFIDARGDSLVLDGTPDVRIVNIGGRIFYHHPRAGYIEIVLQMPIALGVKRILSVLRKEVVGDNGYGQTSFTTTAVSSLYRNSPSVFSNYDILYEKENVYFFIDNRNTPVLANRISLFRLFPDHKPELKHYLRKNRINFKRERDMVNLTNYVARFY